MRTFPGSLFFIRSKCFFTHANLGFPAISNSAFVPRLTCCAKKGDKVVAFDDEAPVDTILGVDIFPVVHVKTQEKIYVGLEDLVQ